MKKFTHTCTCSECGHEFKTQGFELDMPERAPIRISPNVCEDCSEAERKREAAERKAEAERARREELLARNVPLRYRAATFDNFICETDSQRRALDAMRDNAAGGVLLTGPAGCGKTHLAAAAISVGPVGGLFVGAAELLDDMRRGFDGGGRGLFDRALAAPLLVVDDLGQESVTDWVRDRLYVLANSRWNNCLPLVVTTNYGPDALGDRIGTGTASRIIGICAHRLQVKGPDRRKARPA